VSETPTLVAHQRITGSERATFAASLAQEYRGGASIRDLASKHNRSYGSIRSMLTEVGTPLRGRGSRPRAEA
jgi:hypothetical protein